MNEPAGSQGATGLQPRQCDNLGLCPSAGGRGGGSPGPGEALLTGHASITMTPFAGGSTAWGTCSPGRPRSRGWRSLCLGTGTIGVGGGRLCHKGLEHSRLAALGLSCYHRPPAAERRAGGPAIREWAELRRCQGLCVCVCVCVCTRAYTVPPFRGTHLYSHASY